MGRTKSASTICDRLASLFRAHPGRRFTWRELASVAGGAAWRTRVSDLRHPPYSMTIRNAWWVQTGQNGTQWRESVYWYELSR